VAQFEAAADAIVSGEIEVLKRFLGENPNLVEARSNREHRATLLHYTSANGVEGYRQKTPKNIVEIAKMLLDSGAQVNAEADVYGGGCTALGLAATSVHPQVAGVQEQLLQLLLDHGALIEKPNLAGNKHSAVIACLANGQPRAAEFLAVRGAHLDFEGVAGIGRVDLLKTFFHSDGSLKPPATKKQLQSGFLWACMYGHEGATEFLLEHGADLLDPADSGATALHWAAGGGHVNVVKLLLDHGAPLEDINMWGGTVLEHAGWGFEHSAPGTDFVPTFERLLAAGAKIRGRWLAWIEKLKDRSEQEKAGLAEILRRYGATA
jgi:ankyrin repeat protein